MTNKTMVEWFIVRAIIYKLYRTRDSSHYSRHSLTIGFPSDLHITQDQEVPRKCHPSFSTAKDVQCQAHLRRILVRQICPSIFRGLSSVVPEFFTEPRTRWKCVAYLWIIQQESSSHRLFLFVFHKLSECWRDDIGTTCKPPLPFLPHATKFS